jgi:hypothetical protein
MLRITRESVLGLALEAIMIVPSQVKILVRKTYSIINYCGLRIYLGEGGFI